MSLFKEPKQNKAVLKLVKLAKDCLADFKEPESQADYFVPRLALSERFMANCLSRCHNCGNVKQGTNHGNYQVCPTSYTMVFRIDATLFACFGHMGGTRLGPVVPVTLAVYLVYPDKPMDYVALTDSQLKPLLKAFALGRVITA